jgi:hypothetical protein
MAVFLNLRIIHLLLKVFKILDDILKNIFMII